MSFNLLEKLQQSLDYPPLHKIDPNMEKNEGDNASQSEITAVLTGFYRYVQSDEGATTFLRGDNSTNWAEEIFEDHSSEVIQSIATCSNQSEISTSKKINIIANETVNLVKQHLGANATIKDVKTFFTNQRNNILLYLPPSLHLGDWLHDTSLDDATNKMEGPISSLIKNIGNAFSNPVTKDEVQHP